MTSLLRKYGASASVATPGDVGSPGFAPQDPATFTAPYDIWAAANDLWLPAEIAPAADPDGDGRTNRAEYAFGGSPRIADQAPSQAITSAGEDFEWSYSRRSDDASLAFSLQFSADLDGWTTLVPLSSTQVADPQLAGFVRITSRVAKDGASKFLRLRAE